MQNEKIKVRINSQTDSEWWWGVPSDIPQEVKDKINEKCKLFGFNPTEKEMLCIELGYLATQQALEEKDKEIERLKGKKANIFGLLKGYSKFSRELHLAKDARIKELEEDLQVEVREHASDVKTLQKRIKELEEEKQVNLNAFVNAMDTVEEQAAKIEKLEKLLERMVKSPYLAFSKEKAWQNFKQQHPDIWPE